MDSITVLGTYGGRGKNKSTTSFHISESIIIDAGNVIHPLGQEAKKIDYIFLTHCHLDHIIDIPFLIDAFFSTRVTPLHIYALPETIAALKKYILNWDIWPDFNEIELLNNQNKSLLLHAIEIGKEYHVEGVIIKPFPTNHTVASCGYVVTKNGKKAMITADTYVCDAVWEELNRDNGIKTLVIEVSFPSRFDKLAQVSKHLTPKLLAQELTKLRRNDVTIYINHMKPDFVPVIAREIEEYGLGKRVQLLDDGYVITL